MREQTHLMAADTREAAAVAQATMNHSGLWYKLRLTSPPRLQSRSGVVATHPAGHRQSLSVGAD